MKKQEALHYMKIKEAEGYSTFPLIIDSLYEDDEDIPQSVIDLCCFIPDPPGDFLLFMSPGLEKALNEDIEKYIFNSVQEDIKEEIDKYPKS